MKQSKATIGKTVVVVVVATAALGWLCVWKKGKGYVFHVLTYQKVKKAFGTKYMRKDKNNVAAPPGRPQQNSSNFPPRWQESPL